MCFIIPLSLSDADCEKITAVLLKSRTGEFDLESILFLKLRGLGKVKLLFHYLSKYIHNYIYCVILLCVL